MAPDSTTLLGMAPDSSPCSIHLNLEVPGDRCEYGALGAIFCSINSFI